MHYRLIIDGQDVSHLLQPVEAVVRWVPTARPDPATAILERIELDHRTNTRTDFATWLTAHPPPATRSARHSHKPRTRRYGN